MTEGRRVVLVPGRRLGPWVPQLLFPAFAAMRRGAQPAAVEWTDVETVDGLDEHATMAWVEERLHGTLDEGDEGVEDTTVVVGKSLGSYAAPLAGHVGAASIWVTPLLTSRVVRDGLLATSAPFLLVGGTADALWDGDFARAVTPHVLELPGADHGLFVPGPLERSAANIGLLAAAVETFLDEVVWPVR